MIKVENIQVTGWEPAIRGMRNPMNSWDRSDSGVCGDFKTIYKDGMIGCGHNCPKWSPDTYCGYSEHLQKFPYDYYMVGKNDLDLMKRLFQGGTEHRKFMRMIVVYMDISAPLYWWKEYDTYKVGTVANSCSTMHKIHAKEFVPDDFSHENLDEAGLDALKCAVSDMNWYRDRFLTDHNKSDWYNMIQILPSSYNQKRTVMINYEVAATIIRQRTGHKLDEWNMFVDVLKELPYLMEIMQ